MHGTTAPRFIAVLIAGTSLCAPRAAQAHVDSPRKDAPLYHSPEGLVCEDCHVLHAGERGSGSPSLEGQRAALLAGSITDLCLRCHRAHAGAASRAPIVMTANGVAPEAAALPGGDFYWSASDPRKGHNPGRTRGTQSTWMPSDPVLSGAPGGDFSTDDFDCVTCHDPHDRFGRRVAAWRQLKRRVNGVVHTGNETVAAGVESDGGSEGPTTPGFEPIQSNSRGDSEGIALVNRRKDGHELEGADLFAPEGDANKNVYRGGFSSFCSVCHGDFHGGGAESRVADNGRTRAGGSWHRHPSNIAMGEPGNRYGIAAYATAVVNSQGTNPNPAGYDWKYPLVKADRDFTVRSATASGGDRTTAAPTDRITCLTCHRAHASPFANMTRWDTHAHAYLAAGARDFAGEVSPGDNPAYGCNKCHRMGGSKAFRKAF